MVDLGDQEVALLDGGAQIDIGPAQVGNVEDHPHQFRAAPVVPATTSTGDDGQRRSPPGRSMR